MTAEEIRLSVKGGCSTLRVSIHWLATCIGLLSLPKAHGPLLILCFVVILFNGYLFLKEVV